MENKNCNRPRQLIAELIRDCRYDVHVYDRGYRSLVPGYVINNLSEEQRVILRELKSDDITDIRWSPYK